MVSRKSVHQTGLQWCGQCVALGDGIDSLGMGCRSFRGWIVELRGEAVWLLEMVLASWAQHVDLVSTS